MVAGAHGTGKTSLLKLFLDTSVVSPAATAEQKTSVETFLSTARKSTKELRTACIEIAENRFDRVLLTLIDTPGLDFSDGKELKCERDVTALVKYLDLQYDETMGEESKVVRQSKGDQHVHLYVSRVVFCVVHLANDFFSRCIYLIDPTSITTAMARRNKSLVPGLSPKDSTDINDASDMESDDDNDEISSPLSMNPSEIRVIKRLAARVNVLPVIARADSLTESRLRAVKRTVRRELEGAGVGFGVFEASNRNARAKLNGHKVPAAEPDASRRATMDEAREDELQAEGAEEEDDDRKARPVIRIRARKSFTGTERERSQSRRRRSVLDASPERSDDDAQPPLPDGDATGANGYNRFNRAALNSLLPFALVTPQHARRRNVPKAAKEADEQTEAHQEVTSIENANGELLTPSVVDHEREPQTPTSALTNRRSWSSVPPSSFPATYQTPQNVQSLAAAAAAVTSEYGPLRTFPRGQFIRKYKWGTLDVLDPAHCDFVALRTAVLSTHFRGLKVNTREVLYERYRTEKLLARRATRNIGGEERKRLLEDLGL